VGSNVGDAVGEVKAGQKVGSNVGDAVGEVEGMKSNQMLVMQWGG